MSILEYIGRLVEKQVFVTGFPNICIFVGYYFGILRIILKGNCNKKVFLWKELLNSIVTGISPVL